MHEACVRWSKRDLELCSIVTVPAIRVGEGLDASSVSSWNATERDVSPASRFAVGGRRSPREAAGPNPIPRLFWGRAAWFAVRERFGARRVRYESSGVGRMFVGERALRSSEAKRVDVGPRRRRVELHDVSGELGLQLCDAAHRVSRRRFDPRFWLE